jgi:hypothetical protein
MEAYQVLIAVTVMVSISSLILLLAIPLSLFGAAAIHQLVKFIRRLL